MNRILLMLKGAAMGMAEVVPGVSGGTIAFITGIYEELLNTIKGIKPSLIRTWRKEGFNSFWKAINGNFIVFLGSGMLIGLVFFVFFISHFLENNPEMLLAFFFGLILASSVYIWRQVEDKGWTQIVVFFIGVVVAYVLTVVNPGAGSTSLIYLFFCGMIAISALILPGISGSFIMLLLGMYSTIILNVKNFITSFEFESFLVLLAFGSGCLIGIFSFARVLSYAFENFKNPTLAILTGFMVGSLNKIWPWKIPTSWMDENGIIHNQLIEQDWKVIKEINILPGDYSGDVSTGIIIIALLFGFFLVYGLDYYDRKSKLKSS